MTTSSGDAAGEGADVQRWVDGDLESGADGDGVVGAEDLQGEESTFEPEESTDG